MAASPGTTRAQSAGQKQAAAGKNDLAAFEGEWTLYFNGKEIKVGHWPQTDKNGKKFGGQEIRGPYRIVKEPRNFLAICHGSVPWMLMLPLGTGTSFRALRNANGYDLGPDWGNDQVELRVRPGGKEMEIWKNKYKLYESTKVEMVFSGYTLVRGGAKSYSGASKNTSL